MSWHETLSSIERKTDGPQDQPRSRDNREASTRGLALGSAGCWCGKPGNHDWDGKAEGKPHPRTP